MTDKLWDEKVPRASRKRRHKRNYAEDPLAQRPHILKLWGSKDLKSLTLMPRFGGAHATWS